MNEDLKISEMLDFSKQLWEKNKNSWSPMSPEYGKDFILYMIEEIGEVIAILKKKGCDSVMKDKEIRNHFTEEMCDVMMYFSDTLNRFGISPKEFSDIYTEKFNKNLKRNYTQEYKNIK